MTDKTDFIGIVKELQNMRSSPYAYTDAVKERLYEEFPIIAEALLLAVEGLEKLRYDSAAREILEQIHSLPLP